MLAEKFHRRAKVELPSVTAHAALHAIVENQLALGLGCVVRAAPRLVSQDLSRHDAIHAVASVLAEHLHEQATAQAPDTAEVVQARYEAAVERLNAKDWLAKYGSQ
jgi:predicted transcriptional regulator